MCACECVSVSVSSCVCEREREKGEGERERSLSCAACLLVPYITSSVTAILLTSQLSLPCTGGGLSVNYSSDEVTPTLHEYATQLLEACPALSSASTCMKSRERGEGGKRGESGDGGQENSRLTIITGALRSLLSSHSLSFHCPSYPPSLFFTLFYSCCTNTWHIT